MLDFTQEGPFRPFSKISTITTSADRVPVCEPDVAQGQEGKAEGRSVLRGVNEFICQLNGYLRSSAGKSACSCLLPLQIYLIYLQGVRSAFHVL